MASDNNIHRLFADKGVEGLGSIDTASVIRRAKRRRLPAQIATGAAAVLVLGGVGVAALQTIPRDVPEAETAALQSEDAGELAYGDADTKSTPESARIYAENLNPCGSPLTPVDATSSGLELTVAFPDADAGVESVEGVATLTNTGASHVVGWTGVSPAITLSQGGISVWHSNGAAIQMAIKVDLEPGESMEYPAAFAPVQCSSEDESDAGFRSDLPALPSGEYQVSAAIFVDGDLNGNAYELVGGPIETVTLR